MFILYIFFESVFSRLASLSRFQPGVTTIGRGSTSAPGFRPLATVPTFTALKPGGLTHPLPGSKAPVTITEKRKWPGGPTHPSATRPIRLMCRPSGPLGCGHFLTGGYHHRQRIEVGKSHWIAIPLPPNRTGGSPASGSPVDCYCRADWHSRARASVILKSPCSAKNLLG